MWAPRVKKKYQFKTKQNIENRHKIESSSQMPHASCAKNGCNSFEKLYAESQN